MKFVMNISRVFMVRTLGIGKERLEKQGFIDSFLKDQSAVIDHENCLILAFRPNNPFEFQEFLRNETSRIKSIIHHYSYEGGIEMLVYKLDPKFSQDFSLVKKGKYSKTSKEFQNLFSKCVTIKDSFGGKGEEISLQCRVFNKTTDLKKFWEDKIEVEFSEDQELWPIMSMEKETFHISRFQELMVG
jgi:hypothetical protein